MEKIFKILNKYNKNYMYKQSDNKKSMSYYKKKFVSQGLWESVSDDFDYINFTVKRTSYENMDSIKHEFFTIKESLRELWEVISYQERHMLVYNKLSPFLETLKSFEYDGNRYFISFFDHLINAYFDHDMLMFDQDAYRKYLYDISKIVVLDNIYGVEPIKAGFAQMDYIIGDSEHCVMYNMDMRRFYYICEKRKSSVGVERDLSKDEIIEVSTLILEENSVGLIDYLLEHEICSPKSQKRLLKRKRNLES